MKQLSEKTGREKIELMLIWPLAYHPAGEIWQTSAVHATAVNHFVTLQTFICIVLACSRGRRQNPELNQRSVCSVVCLPTTHWKLLVNTQTLLWGILEENIHLLHSNTQRCVWNWAEKKKRLTHAITLAVADIPALSSSQGWVYLAVLVDSLGNKKEQWLGPKLSNVLI